jgi:uncharacterized membrane-anchored protein
METAPVAPVAQAKTLPPFSCAYKETRRRFAAVVVLQLAVLASVAVQPLYTLACGETVALQARTVDPWDLFRGDYVTLTYDINEVPADPTDYLEGEKVYVVIAKQGGQWKPVSMSKTKPQLRPGQKLLQGRNEMTYTTNRCSVRYGIERCYLPERTGHQYSGDLQAQVAIDSSGHCVLKTIEAAH